MARRIHEAPLSAGMTMLTSFGCLTRSCIVYGIGTCQTGQPSAVLTDLLQFKSAGNEAIVQDSDFF
jgi:hypothetical protein